METGYLLEIKGNTANGVDVQLLGKGKHLGCGEIQLVGQRFSFL
jgi:hypothetical protein